MQRWLGDSSGSGFEWRDEWLTRTLEAGMALWRDPKAREALIKAILARDRAAREADGDEVRQSRMIRLARDLAIPDYMGFLLAYSTNGYTADAKIVQTNSATPL